MTQVPTFDQLMWPTLVALKSLGGSASNDELVAKVTEVAGVSEVVAAIMHNDNRQSRLAYNLAWAKTYLKKVGALENSKRGVWSLTEHGETLTAEQIKAVPSQVRSSYGYSDADVQSNDAGQAVVDPANSGEVVAWRDVLLGSLKIMSPDAFERLAQRLLREAGFIKVEVTGERAMAVLTASASFVSISSAL